MYSEKYWRLFQKFLYLGELFHAHSLQFDKAHHRFHLQKSKRYLTFHYIIIIYIALDCAYLSVILRHTSASQFSSSSEFFQTYAHWITRSIAVLFGILILYQREEYVRILNTYLKFPLLEELTDAEEASRANYTKVGRATIYIAIFASLLQPLGPTITYLNETPNLRYWHSTYLPNSWILILPWGIWEYIISLYSIYQAIFGVTLLSFYMPVTWFWLKVLYLGGQMKTKQLLIFRTLQVLMARCNECFRYIWSIGQLFLLIAHIFINSGAIALIQALEIKPALALVAGCILLTTFELVAYPAAGNFYVLSMEIQRKYPYPRKNKLELCRRKSCRRIAIDVQSFYFLDNWSFMVFENSIVNLTASYLLAQH